MSHTQGEDEDYCENMSATEQSLCGFGCLCCLCTGCLSWIPWCILKLMKGVEHVQAQEELETASANNKLAQEKLEAARLAAKSGGDEDKNKLAAAEKEAAEAEEALARAVEVEERVRAEGLNEKKHN
uniref:Uncharacterized protein n=1 Tax=Eutreptiella gymnastica TaxID=73025 RepID=A0A7S1IFT1_9EUGL|mmetsp:Transcript_153580/g.268565  ORF Transcript_153580/g.268565 Transcript_153580/m.268565 type:complete len:127 (+) Transcript_153580:165-545(+)